MRGSLPQSSQSRQKIGNNRGAMNMNSSMSFDERCYQLLKLIPEGKVTTYGEIARALNTKAWRAVGSAMAKNKNLFVIPCHRVVRSDGAIGQYALGTDKKASLLMGEGVEIVNGRVKNLGAFIHKFNT
jgi:methylated-DNA-[protein]-cysteine S-methyltransferase